MEITGYSSCGYIPLFIVNQCSVYECSVYERKEMIEVLNL
jgi:hypothetical protein